MPTSDAVSTERAARKIGEAKASSSDCWKQSLYRLILEKAEGLNFGEITIHFMAGQPRRIVRIESELIE